MGAEHIVTITSGNFAQEVTQSTVPVLVDFWAPWCGPCKAIAPILDELATEYQGKAKIGKVNVDDEQTLAAQYNITGIPTLLLVKGGQVVDMLRGQKSKKDYKASLDKVLA